MIVERDADYTPEPCYRRSSPGSCSVSKRKSREIGESPSMMWNRLIVQGCEGGRRRAAAALAPALLLLALARAYDWSKLQCMTVGRPSPDTTSVRGDIPLLNGGRPSSLHSWNESNSCGAFRAPSSEGARAADLVIEIPGSGGGGAGRYRLDYWPPEGLPAPNYTVAARAATINFTGLPGTRYRFMLYYSNDSLADLLTWNQSIVTAPEPPAELAVAPGRAKTALVTWAPPAHGDYTGFRFRVLPLTEREAAARDLAVDAAANRSLVLRDLAPGASYQLHAFTLLHDKDSAAYASRNFTTKPNTPGKFIVWFRNETTLLVLWQPPYPPGFYTHYKVSIEPGDARDSELYVEKEGEPPGPAQAAFKGLVPGRAYNISVQTVSEPEASAPTTAQYRTVPLRPRDVRVPRDSLTERSFRVEWQPPLERAEFDKYQVSVAGEGRRLPAAVRARADPPHAAFDQLEPGARYTVTVKTMSGKVTSWPATADVTLKPLPVLALRVERGPDGALAAHWAPAPGSQQDEYRVAWREPGEDGGELAAPAPPAALLALLPGRNYSVSVRAVSRGVPSEPSGVSAATRPLAPLVLAAAGAERELRLEWRAAPSSRQDAYRVRYARAAEPEPRAWAQLDTPDAGAVLADLFPGAVYEVRVAAVAHGLPGDEQVLLRAVRPLPPRALTVRRATSTSAVAEWSGPARAASAVGEYTLRYRTLSAAGAGEPWRALVLPASAARAELAGLTPGERYQVELEAGSERAPDADGVPSGAPRRAEHTVRPAPASNVAALADTRNVTLEWPRAAGRVERYELRWAPAGEPEPARRAAVPDPGPGAASVRAVLPDLEPGRAYAIAITAASYNLTSDEFSMETRTRPLIQSEMTIVTEPEGEAEEEPGILVTYTPTPPAATLFDAYRFRLEGAEGAGGARTAERAAAEPARRVRFAGLVPGALYNVTMWTVSRNVSSHPVQRAVRLFPRAVRWLNATRVAAREVELAWGEPAGVHTDFEVQYLAAADTLRTHTAPRAPLLVPGLRPHTLYTFTVVVRAGAAAALRTVSRAVSAAVATAQAPPPAPRRFRPADAAPGELAFEWELPADEANGRLERFVLEYWPRDEPARVRELRFGPEARGGSVRGLRPGAEYEFLLAGETGAGRGEAARWAQRMAIAAPPRPAPDALPEPAHATPTTVAVRLRADLFSPANGEVTAYTLVVAEEARDAPAALPSWRDVRRLPRWPPYQVAEPWPPRAAEFTIGAERCDERAAPAYCNGPLKPATRYFVKVRAFTAPDKFTDTEYAEVRTEADHTAWLAAGGAAAALAAAAAAAALAWRRRRRARPAAPPGPAPRTSRPVRVADFVDHYRVMSADSDFRFSEEFEELKHVGREQPCTAADLPVNRPKNRFTNILPYDHSRYKLRPVDDEEGSDYINANYVPGHGSPREFIVTQGPLHATRDDFWRMVWESGSRAVVMLTRCVEKGREKCDRYWPYDTRPALYGDIAVTALNESRYPDWTVTELAVARGAEQRRLLHFHFTTWPDFGVPEPPTTLARFVRAFRERVPPDARPVVVHCSAGVGRSGTFITLDTALQQLARGADALDIFGMVHAMRKERVWMVQTEQQYICIHQCLVAVLEGQDLAPPHNNHHLNPAFEDDEGIAESGM